MARPLALLVLLAIACDQRPAPRPAAQAPAPPAPAAVPGQPRRVDIRVTNLGYTPERVAGRPGEVLTLAFRYEDSAGECGREVLLPATGAGAPARLRLEAGKAVEAQVRLPDKKGELTFTCGMNMLKGTLIAE